MSRVGALLLTGFGVAVLVASASAALPRSPIAARQSILVMPAPAKGARAKDRLDRNDDCVACHSDVASEWSHSLHRQSFSDPMFQAALDRYKRNYQAPGREMGQLDYRDVRVDILCADTAFVRGFWHLAQSGGKEPHGVFTLLMRKLPEGWKIVHDHSSGE